MVWHVDKYKITFKLVIDHWPRARYRAAARRFRNIGLALSLISILTPLLFFWENRWEILLLEEFLVAHILEHTVILTSVMRLQWQSEIIWCSSVKVAWMLYIYTPTPLPKKNLVSRNRCYTICKKNDSSPPHLGISRLSWRYPLHCTTENKRMTVRLLTYKNVKVDTLCGYFMLTAIL
jgi:hypothetical protein